MPVTPDTSKPSDLAPVRTGPLPEQVRDRLMNAMADGVFKDYLPSEEELARQLGVSRPTIRVALRSLEDAGVIVRHRGVGTQINSHVLRIRLNLDNVVGFFDLIKQAGHVPDIKWTKVHSEPASTELAVSLQCAAGSTVMMVDRLFLADGEPAIKVREIVETALLTSAVDEEHFPDSVFDFAARYTPEPIDHTIVELTPLVADEALAAELSLTPGAPLLRLTETHYSAKGQLVLLSEVHVVDRFVRFNIVRRNR